MSCKIAELINLFVCCYKKHNERKVYILSKICAKNNLYSFLYYLLCIKLKIFFFYAFCFQNNVYFCVQFRIIIHDDEQK